MNHSTRPSSLFHSSGAGGYEGIPDVPLHSNVFQLLQGNPEADEISAFGLHWCLWATHRTKEAPAHSVGLLNEDVCLEASPQQCRSEFPLRPRNPIAIWSLFSRNRTTSFSLTKDTILRSPNWTPSFPWKSISWQTNWWQGTTTAETHTLSWDTKIYYNITCTTVRAKQCFHQIKVSGQNPETCDLDIHCVWIR